MQKTIELKQLNQNTETALFFYYYNISEPYFSTLNLCCMNKNKGHGYVTADTHKHGQIIGK